jgi:hypothetical protein
MNKEQTEPTIPKCTEKSICIAFDSESEYREIVVDKQKYRAYLEQALSQRPELFPQGISAGFTLHDLRESKKQPGLLLRRIKLKASQTVYTVRPSFVMPYMIAKTDEIEKALYLRQWGVPFSALVYVFGHDTMFWYRAWLRLGRTNLVGSTVKTVERMPVHLVADEKITWLAGAEISVPTTVGGGCILGITIAETDDGTMLKQAYGEFAAESAVAFPTYQPASVCTDGWKATREAWRCLFPGIALVLCYLHSILKISQRCTGALRHTVLTKAWHVYRAPTKAAFAQRMRRLREWNQQQLSGSLASMVEKLCAHKADFLPAYDCPGALRTSNAVDRLLNHVDRQLYAMYYFHGTSSAAKMAVRAMAMQWNFHPYGSRLRQRHPERLSPFSDLNGFVYHENWLHNCLIASSMGGTRP